MTSAEDWLKQHEQYFLRDPVVKELTKGKVQSAIDSYKSLLDSCAPEQEVHDLLRENSYFFSELMRMHGQSPLYSKIKLGNEYETDFVYFDLGSFGPDWKLIEIERPGARLFTKSGSPTAELNHAIDQIRCWQDWIVENSAYAQKLMPGIRYPHGYVFIGRRSELTPDNMKKLRRLSYECRSYAHIHTLDRLTDGASYALHNINDESGGNWTVPLRAYLHKDLKNRKPRETFYWLDRALQGHRDTDHLHKWRNWDYPGSEYREELGFGDLGY